MENGSPLFLPELVDVTSTDKQNKFHFRRDMFDERFRGRVARVARQYLDDPVSRKELKEFSESLCDILDWCQINPYLLQFLLKNTKQTRVVVILHDTVFFRRPWNTTIAPSAPTAPKESTVTMSLESSTDKLPAGSE